MKKLFTWYSQQTTFIKIFLPFICIVIISALLPKSEEQVQREKQESRAEFVKDSLSKLSFFQQPQERKKEIIHEAFGGLYPPQWIEICKATKGQFKYPEETEIDSPKQYGILNIDSGFVWFATEVHSKNGFGVKTTHTLKAHYKMAKDGSGFACYRYFVE